MTVGELKELLKNIPDDVIVQTEGCDCIGPADGISEISEESFFDGEDYMPKVNTVYIKRNNYLFYKKRPFSV